MKKLLLLLYSLGILFICNAQGFEWVKSKPVKLNLNSEMNGIYHIIAISNKGVILNGSINLIL